jgi:hypothetical protein
MTFEEILAQIIEVLQREKRISYRALKRRFALDCAYLDDLKEDLIYAKHMALDEDSRVLVWSGDTTTPRRGNDARADILGRSEPRRQPLQCIHRRNKGTLCGIGDM